MNITKLHVPKINNFDQMFLKLPNMISLVQDLKNLSLLVNFKNRNCSWSLPFFLFSANATSTCVLKHIFN